MSFRSEDGVAIVEAIALVGSWVWVKAEKFSYSGLRHKASLAALVCASVAVFLLLISTIVIHWLVFGEITRNVLLVRSLSLGFLSAIGVLSSLSLIFGLLGKGKPRMLAFAWLCILLYQSVPVLSVLHDEWRDRATIENALAALAGKGAINCGYVRYWTDPRPSSECVLNSFASHKPFYVVYDFQAGRIDSRVMDALAGDKSGNLSDVELSSMGWSAEEQNGETPFMDGGHISVEPCPKPIVLSKSIYGGLTCIARIMGQPSDDK